MLGSMRGVQGVLLPTRRVSQPRGAAATASVIHPLMREWMLSGHRGSAACSEAAACLALLPPDFESHLQCGMA
jgi:hypothetical protein